MNVHYSLQGIVFCFLLFISSEASTYTYIYNDEYSPKYSGTKKDYKKSKDNSSYHYRTVPTWYKNVNSIQPSYYDKIISNEINSKRWKKYINKPEESEDSLIFEPLREDVVRLDTDTEIVPISNNNVLKNSLRYSQIRSMDTKDHKNNANGIMPAEILSDRQRKRNKESRRKKNKGKRRRKKKNKKRKNNRKVKKQKKGNRKNKKEKRKNKTPKKRKSKELNPTITPNISTKSGGRLDCQFRNLKTCSAELASKWKSELPCIKRTKFLDCMEDMRKLPCTHPDHSYSPEMKQIREQVIKEIHSNQSCLAFPVLPVVLD